MTVLDSILTKSVGHFEENKFSVGCHQFCWTAVQNWLKPTILVKVQSMKDSSKTKMNTIVQLGCLISKLLRLFVNFLFVIVIFLPWMVSHCPCFDHFHVLHNGFNFGFQYHETVLLFYSLQTVWQVGKLELFCIFWKIILCS